MMFLGLMISMPFLLCTLSVLCFFVFLSERCVSGIEIGIGLGKVKSVSVGGFGFWFFFFFHWIRYDYECDVM